jgi:hypothetical protein
MQTIEIFIINNDADRYTKSASFKKMKLMGISKAKANPINIKVLINASSWGSLVEKEEDNNTHKQKMENNRTPETDTFLPFRRKRIIAKGASTIDRYEALMPAILSISEPTKNNPTPSQNDKAMLIENTKHAILLILNCHFSNEARRSTSQSFHGYIRGSSHY